MHEDCSDSKSAFNSNDGSERVVWAQLGVQVED